MNDMKILHVNSYFSTRQFYKGLFDSIRQKGIINNVYVPVSKQFRGNLNVESYAYGILSKCYTSLDRYVFHVKHYKILNDIQKQFDISNYSLLHAHSLFSNGYIAYKLQKKYKINYIVAIRNTDVNLFFKKMIHLRYLGIKILRNASAIVFLSKSYKDYVMSSFIPVKYRKAIESKIKIIPNGIDDFWFDNINDFKKAYNNPLRLLQVGDINKNKNLITSIDAVEKLNKLKIPTKLTAIGNVVDNFVYTRASQSKYVSLHKAVDKERLLMFYRSHDIFLLPSHKESFGLVYAEAMTQGLPLIFSYSQGFDKQFPDGLVGFSVYSNNSYDIVSAVERIRRNYKELSNNSVINSTKFSWDKISSQYIELYKQIEGLNN